jgi:HD superfamily phosphodiesterase
LVAEGTSQMVANHSHRTYAWAAVLAAHDGLRYDKEVVYVASLLHDLYAESPRVLPNPHCFTLPEADRTEELAASAG